MYISSHSDADTLCSSSRHLPLASLADTLAIASMQRPEGKRRQNRNSPQRQKCMMQRTRHGQRSVCDKSPKYQLVISDPHARPKLSDICCSELEMVLAMLESDVSMSA